MSAIQQIHCVASPQFEKVLYRTKQLPATHRKVEGGERDIQLVHVNEANSCLARGYCVQYTPRKESGAYQAPPLWTHALPMLNLCDFQRPRPKARMASI